MVKYKDQIIVQINGTVQTALSNVAQVHILSLFTCGPLINTDTMVCGVL